ncbi:conserved hypothetical protein containing outer membrane protein beta-barrel domain [Formosa agariphila KMM 3901]|uniref:Outer membrane protein beta-barrel domain-containing protein n=1 Tax=Formosa agariphila (strain DSM 15362 / KCTC 12365 / LMG 23005 / KMM 3901 / M-2Alg 35-1) TaxID=1347342 RepID=T2KRR9_FORAG|nr:porin family protein [Formosa agariphila]CDF81171.1 conserved hypothetical protein containing outer membrane protein beta-barrel domain [Formosa agariphila KMM 3901]
MSDKKNIDRLFQERLKDLDVTPHPEVWNGIEAKLKTQQKPKRVIPIWWRAAGIAAILLLFLALGNFIFNSKTSSNNTPNTILVDTPSFNNSDLKNESTVTSTPQEDTTTLKPLDSISKKSSHSPHNSINSTQIVNQSKKQNLNPFTKKNSPSTTEATAIVTNTPNTPSTSKHATTNTTIASGNKNSTTPFKRDTISKSISKQSIFTQEHPQIATNDVIKNAPELLNKNTTIDSLSIEDAIAATNTHPKVDNKLKKWDIHPNIAPVYYSSTGKGSHLDDQFISNSKSGEINTSYGVGIGYAINKKIKLRSGINNLKLSFNTNDVVLLENPGISSSRGVPNLQHVSKTNQSQNYSFLNANKVSTIQNSTFTSNNESGSINQNISYFELPLEVEYNILNKRIAINVIGGFSTFILEDNQIYSENNTSRILIGEATNINDFSFSTNFGIGFDYNFSKRFNFNLEPTFKYQLNAYNNTSGNFKPYIIGVYTGFSFKF